MTSIATDILLVLNERKEIQGTEALTLLLNKSVSSKRRVFSEAIALHRLGMIEMIVSPGGRGKKTIYRDCGVIKVQR